MAGEKTAYENMIENRSRDYQAAFSTPALTRILADILTKNYFFSECKTEEERIKRNVAVKILEDMGVLQHQTIMPITIALIDIAKKYPIKLREESNHGRCK